MTTKKTYKLDLFGKVLPALDRRDFSLYSKLTDEERKNFADIVILRYMSNAKTASMDILEYIIAMTNEANKHLWNSALKDHGELKCMILATSGVGVGIKINHEFIKAPIGKKRNNKMFDVVRRYYPTASINELQMFIDMNNEDDLIEIGKMLGLQKEELNVYKKEVKRIKK